MYATRSQRPLRTTYSVLLGLVAVLGLGSVDAQAESWKKDPPKAAQDMCKLVMRIATHPRVDKKEADFLIATQNGATMLDETMLDEVSEKLSEAYMGTVDAIAAEDTFYFGDRKHNNALRPQKDAIKALRRFQKHGLPVLAVDYLTRKNFAALAHDRDFIPYVGHRKLDRLVVQPGSKK